MDALLLTQIKPVSKLPGNHPSHKDQSIESCWSGLASVSAGQGFGILGIDLGLAAGDMSRVLWRIVGLVLKLFCVVLCTHLHVDNR